MHTMKKITTTALVTASSLIMVSCGAGSKEKKGAVGDVKVKLEKLRIEKTSLDAEIRQLEDQLAKIDPNAAQQIKKLVGVDTIRIQDFSHYIDLQGKIDADNIAYVAPSGQGGMVKAVYVKLGSRVSKGQLMLKLDDALTRQSVVAAQQQISGIKAQLAQAQSILERQQNLWKENIGTEIQVITAKTTVATLQSQLKAAQAGVSLAQEQVNLSNVYAQISGVVDEMNVRPGEFFSPQTAAQPGMGIKIVNSNNLKIVTQVPTNYVGRVTKGDKVVVEVEGSPRGPIATSLTTVGASIDPKTQSFIVEAKLPSDPALKPNQTAMMKILDYQAKGAIVAPVNVVQTDATGKYVFVIVKEGDKQVARKKVVNVGEVYEGMIEIKSGLSEGDIIITEGYQTIYDGQNVTTVN